MNDHPNPARATQVDAPTCPLCFALEHVRRPLALRVTLRAGNLHESWRCSHCHAVFIPPSADAAAPPPFGAWPVG